MIAGFFLAIGFSQVVNDSQLIKGNHWIYDSLEILSQETKNAIFLDTRPISVGELKFYLSQIDFEKLSHSGKSLYKKAESFLFTTKYIGKNSNGKIIPKESATRLSIGLKLNPELYARTNENVDSTITYYYKDWPITVPFIFGVAENVALEFDYLYNGKNYTASKAQNSFTNFATDSSQREFEYPKYAYGNIYTNQGNWGLSATFGKEGFSIGNTKLGSVIYNSTFETDFYSTISTYSSNFKYNLIFSQVERNKFLYLHNFNFILWEKLKLGLTEGCLLDGPFEAKYLNPAMILHSFYAGFKYSENDPLNRYDLDNHYCSYLGVTLDFYPIDNMRLYALWAQNELQLGGELNSDSGKMLPDSIGLQLGIDYSLPDNFNGYYLFNIEGLYTTPYLYVKQSPDWSLIHYRIDYLGGAIVPSWIGSPFGPDTFALTCSAIYEKPQKWSCGFEYLLTMKGEIDANTLLKTATAKDDPNGPSYPSYYPPVENALGNLSTQDAIKKARDISLTGIIQYKNDFVISGEYYFSPKIKVSSEGTYSLIFNNHHIQDDFQQGFELKLACCFNIF